MTNDEDKHDDEEKENQTTNDTIIISQKINDKDHDDSKVSPKTKEDKKGNNVSISKLKVGLYLKP